MPTKEAIPLTAIKQRIKIYIWLLPINRPMVRRFFVVKKQYFTEEELINMAAVAQSTPGAIAVNLSALAGYKAAGMAGAVISCCAAVIPPLYRVLENHIDKCAL